MTSRHRGPWVPGISATAHLVLGNLSAAEAEFTLMRATLTPLVGQYQAARTEELHRLLAAFYRGEHESVVAFGAGLPPRFWTLSSFPVGRSLWNSADSTKQKGNWILHGTAGSTFPAPDCSQSSPVCARCSRSSIKANWPNGKAVWTTHDAGCGRFSGGFQRMGRRRRKWMRPGEFYLGCELTCLPEVR